MLGKDRPRRVGLAKALAPLAVVALILTACARSVTAVAPNAGRSPAAAVLATTSPSGR